MKELKISPDFTIDDIHKVREYNYEMTKDMTEVDRRAYYRKGAEEVERRIEEIRKQKSQQAQ